MRIVKRAMALLVIAASGLVVIAGCAAAPRSESAAVAPQAEAPLADRAAPAGESYDGGALEGVASDRMIIRTGELSLVVKDTAAAMDEITSLVESFGGYVAHSNAYRSGDLLRGSMTVRVPAAQFDQAFSQLKELALRVDRQGTSGEDVTEEYTDLSARLTNLEATEVELRELLATVRQQTGKAEDILAVYRELTDIRGQIEQLRGRMQYLERMTDLATINIDLTPDEMQKPIVAAAWQPGATLRNATRSLLDAFRFIADALIWFVAFVLPILVIVAIPIVLLFWVLRTITRRRARQG